MPVVDASVAVKWVVQEHDSELARRLVLSEGRELIAPIHVFLEVHHAVAKLLRRAIATPDQLAGAIPLVAQFVATIGLDEDLVIDAALMSQAVPSQPFNIHDCTYIALARAMGEPLITADLGQAAYAERFGVAVQRL